MLVLWWVRTTDVIAIKGVVAAVGGGGGGGTIWTWTGLLLLPSAISIRFGIVKM